jgi:hypothetical protein
MLDWPTAQDRRHLRQSGAGPQLTALRQTAVKGTEW